MASQQGSSKKLRRSKPHHIKGPNKVSRGSLYKQNNDKSRWTNCSQVEAMDLAMLFKERGIKKTVMHSKPA